MVVDDDPHICRALEFALKSQGYEVCLSHSAESARGRMEEWLPDLLVIDVRLPDMDGLTLLERLRHDLRFSTTPVILLTATGTDSTSKVHGLNLGANDYMVKPFSLEELLARVSANLRMAQLTQQMEEMTTRLADLASRDSLTGLYHHGRIVELLAVELHRARQQGIPLSCAMLDLDRFKRINDTFGHQAGDRVIIEVARLLLANCRKTDSVGRYGGDEFLIVLPQAALTSARAKAEDLLSRFGDISVPSVLPASSVSASFGVACAEPPGSLDAATLIHRADEALYRAKSAGGRRVDCWIP